jgi:hypothetical protein
MIGLGLGVNMQRGGLVVPAVLSDGNTVAWYDSQDLTTITKDGSNRVSKWADKLLSTRDLLQAVDPDKPISAGDGLLFDGIDHYMKTAVALFTGANARSIYVVYTNLKTGSYVTNICGQASGSTASTWFLVQARTSGPTGDPYLAAYADDLGNGLTVANNTKKLVTASYSGTVASIDKNGINITSVNKTYNTVNDGFVVGVDNTALGVYGNCRIYDIVVRSLIDGATDKVAIENYLMSKNSV